MLIPSEEQRPVLPTPEEVHALAITKGWHSNTEQSEPLTRFWFPAQIALMHSELSEVLEEYRRIGMPDRGKVTNIATEFADVILRIYSLCGALGLPIEQAIVYKHEFNKTRPHKHGGKLV